MSINKTFVKSNYLFIVYVVLFIPNNLYAYIDPGSGSMLLQALIAGIAGIIFAFKTYVVGFFHKLFRREKKESLKK